MSEINKALNKIQKNLKAPKGQYNSFAKFNYRSCEDILEAVKPLLGEATLTLSDDIKEVGGRVYVFATAQLRLGSDTLSSTAAAREAMTTKGMADSQITGTSSSYARKYALNGLFCIDDTKDADTADNSAANAPDNPTNNSANNSPLPAVLDKISAAKSIDELRLIWSSYNSTGTYTNAINVRKDELS